jgi:alpha-beta hydrolase superfamily lysophospholipase
MKLHELGYAALLVDFRGSGGSSGNFTTIGYFEASDVLACERFARQMLIAPHEPLIFYGQSMGAAALLRAVGDLGATPDAIVIESPYDRLTSAVANRFHAMHLPAFPLAQLLVFWGGVQEGYWGFGMNPAESARRVHCPTLMFHGELDSRVTTVQATSVFDHLAGPKHLELYQQSAHDSFFDGDTDRWSHAVTTFLDTNTHATTQPLGR